jgi:CRP-like cAMP-binding protein
MNYTFLSGTDIFHGLKEEEIETILPCLHAKEKSFPRGASIFRVGDTVSEIGLIESGSVNILVNFYWGDRHIFRHAGLGDIFAEDYASIPDKELLCDVMAAEDTQILFLSLHELLSSCQKRCSFHRQIIHNLVRISASRSLSLSTRMMHTAPKTIRERLLSYLSEQAMEHGSLHFTIPFSRQQLADYLAVDRSALSNELSKMQRDGLLTFRKNEFTLKTKPSSRL